MVDVDGCSHLLADSQSKSIGVVRGLAAIRRSVCIHQMNRVNSRSDHGHDESTIIIVIELLLLLLLLLYLSVMFVTIFFLTMSEISAASSHILSSQLTEQFHDGNNVDITPSCSGKGTYT